MKIIALDSSGLVASVAVMEDENLVGEYTIHHKKTHSQTLLPMLDEVVRITELDLETIDAIAIAAGPGSFTGLRIGSATAKGLGYALDKPLIEVPTLEALAYNLYGVKGLICPLMDARRSQVYTGIYKWNQDVFQIVEQQMAVGIVEIIDKLNHYQEPVVFLGDGVPVSKEILQEKMETAYSFAPAHLLRQRAGAVATRALYYLRESNEPIESLLSVGDCPRTTEKLAKHVSCGLAEGRIVTPEQHRPEYLRVSQAEREREWRKLNS